MTRKYALFFCALFLLNSAASLKLSAAPLTASPQAAVAPKITTQPVSTTVKTGATASFTVVASGTATLKYQWYKNGGAISGATAAKYTTPATTESDNYTNFYVTVTNSAGSATSNPAQLSVVDPPTIFQQPSSVTVTTPGVATFYVWVNSNSSLTFQWYKNNVAISGATDSYYSVSETTTADNGAVFRVKVSNAVASLFSSNATLTVKAGTTAGTYPIVGNWSGTATITSADSGTTTSKVTAAFSQTSYSLTGTIVYTDDDGIPTYGAGVASLNNLNLFTSVGGSADDATSNIAAGFTTNLLTLNGLAGSAEGDGGSGSLTISSDHNTLTGTGKDSLGDTVTWTMKRTK